MKVIAQYYKLPLTLTATTYGQLRKFGIKLHEYMFILYFLPYGPQGLVEVCIPMKVNAVVIVLMLLKSKSVIV